MQADAQNPELKATLAQLEVLHGHEALALRRLARDELDALTDKKLELWERLRGPAPAWSLRRPDAPARSATS